LRDASAEALYMNILFTRDLQIQSFRWRYFARTQNHKAELPKLESVQWAIRTLRPFLQDDAQLTSDMQDAFMLLFALFAGLVDIYGDMSSAVPVYEDYQVRAVLPSYFQAMNLPWWVDDGWFRPK